MNWDTVEGQWNQLKGEIRSKWGKLTDRDLVMLAGKKDKFLGRLQELYGLDRDEAEKQVDDWLKFQNNQHPKKVESPPEHH